ncbi:MAG: methyltransferase [Sarcina sp.]
MEESYYEMLLGIKTLGKQDIEEATIHYNRYEPTEYTVLKRLFENYNLESNDCVIDFGCGKGRLNFYINYYFNCDVVGIEMNKYLYKKAIENKKEYLKKHNSNSKIEFVCELAQNYKIEKNANKFYFFNPFSVEIFMKIIDNILGSFYEKQRVIDIILFYPSDDYVFFMENYTMFNLFNEIKMDDFKKDDRDRILVYRLNIFN